MTSTEELWVDFVKEGQTLGREEKWIGRATSYLGLARGSLLRA